MITVNNYLRATQNVSLPSQVVQANSTLATEFEVWQNGVFSQFFDALLAEEIQAQVSEIASLYTDYSKGALTQAQVQSGAQEAINIEGSSPAMPKVTISAINMATMVGNGEGYVSQLTTIADGIEGADQKTVDQITALADQLSQQFDSDEQKITKGIIQGAEDVFATVFDVAMALEGDEDAIKPLLQGLTNVGKDISTSFDASSDADKTIKELSTTWAALDAATKELASVKLAIQQLNAVLTQSSTTLTALAGVASTWGVVTSLINGTEDSWTGYGFDQVDAWYQQMQLVSFSSQPTVTYTPPS